GGLAVALLVMRAVSAVAAQVAAQERTEYQATHDPLTGLPNRRMATDAVDRMLGRVVPRGAERVWVHLLDLDGFKYVNESWGHDTGDRLVVEVGRRLRETVPPQVTVAALGGDEFLIAHVSGREGAMVLADLIQDCFSRPFPVGEADLTISTSMGIANATGGHEESAAGLLRDADTAMYRAKGEGPGRTVVFDASMLDQVRERIEMEVALRQALTAGQLHVAYQPIVRLETGQPIGAEALVRWTHPERGAISPAVFIPLAEDAGLITEIGTWVRREALRQLGVWRADGTVSDDFYLSINVSPRQLTDSELPLEVADELREAGVPARCVALEMTETVMADGSSVIGRVLLELRELGLRLLIDDFGTGFSALSYLRKFPVTGVKIDRSFVIDMGQVREDDEVVRAVVSLSRALGLTVIAEGVETRLQRDALAAVGVVNGQGWLWGPAVPPAEFAEHWHRSGRAALAGN
ncbi:MAG: EAL domain-containing protein, partial [Actinoplanes sp.]